MYAHAYLMRSVSSESTNRNREENGVTALFSHCPAVITQMVGPGQPSLYVTEYVILVLHAFFNSISTVGTDIF